MRKRIDKAVVEGEGDNNESSSLSEDERVQHDIKEVNIQGCVSP